MQNLVIDVKRKIAEWPARSAWDKGCRIYAMELFDSYIEGKHLTDEQHINKIIEDDLLNGAQDWEKYSYGGRALICNEDICKRLCTRSQQKKTRGGDWKPNRYEEWLDIQAKALDQAARLVLRVANGI